MNDYRENKHFPEKIASNLKFLNNLQPQWSRHVTIVHQTKDLNTANYTQLYDFLKYNQKEIAQPGMNMGQDRQIQMVGGNGGNQFRQYAGQNVGNQNGNGNVVAAQAEGNAIGNNGTRSDKAPSMGLRGSGRCFTQHTNALGYQNPFYLKQAQQKQHSLYNVKVLLEKHDPPDVYDSEETL
ncbi:hypothetical protein Tco_1200656 [Tanacetum coccineum]